MATTSCPRPTVTSACQRSHFTEVAPLFRTMPKPFGAASAVRNVQCSAPTDVHQPNGLRTGNDSPTLMPSKTGVERIPSTDSSSSPSSTVPPSRCGLTDCFLRFPSPPVSLSFLFVLEVSQRLNCVCVAVVLRRRMHPSYRVSTLATRSHGSVVNHETVPLSYLRTFLTSSLFSFVVVWGNPLENVHLFAPCAEILSYSFFPLTPQLSWYRDGARAARIAALSMPADAVTERKGLKSNLLVPSVSRVLLEALTPLIPVFSLLLLHRAAS